MVVDVDVEVVEVLEVDDELVVDVELEVVEGVVVVVVVVGSPSSKAFTP